MTSNVGTDFAVTRAMIDRLDGWVNRLATPLLPAEPASSEEGAPWRVREDTPLALLVLKAVRMASALPAAMTLADAGFVTECACLLRVIGDLRLEVSAVAEAELRGQKTTAQQQFIDQFFSRPSLGSVVSSSPPTKDFVSREELMKADVRLADAVGYGKEKEQARNLNRELNWGYDAYVHGAYETAMELYDPGRHEFMLKGHASEERRRVYRAAVCAKIHETLNALRLIALVERDTNLARELRDAIQGLMDSQEQVLARGAE